MKDLFITDKINLTIALPIGKDEQLIWCRVREYYMATVTKGYITVRGVSLLDVSFVVTLINGIE